MKGIGYDVICPGCKGTYHETGELFDSEATSHGAMFRLKPKYGPKGNNWSSFPFNSSMRSGDLECPSCGALYCGGGVRVTVKAQAVEIQEVKPLPIIERVPTAAHVCPDCGKVCKTGGALAGHMRYCKVKSNG